MSETASKTPPRGGQLVIAMRPPARTTRPSSAIAGSAGRAKITPKTETAASKAPSANGSAAASATMNSPPGTRPRATSISRGELSMYFARMESPSLLVGRIADPSLPFGGTWTYRISAAAGGGSEVTITEDGEIYNPIFRFMARFVL